MNASSRTTTGVALLALVAVIDICWVPLSWFGAVSGADAPPLGALIMFAVVGAVTLATVQPAQRGRRPTAWIMVVSRVVAVLLVDLTALLLGAPAWVDVIVSISIVLTVLGIWWTAPLLSRTGAESAAARTAS